MNQPFCDWVSASVAETDWWDLRDELRPELDAIGMAVDYDQQKETLWRASDGAAGTFRAKSFGAVRVLSATGAVCAGLRAARRFSTFLAIIGARPHRVTRVDASLDVVLDTPPALASAVCVGRAGDISLTRKAVRPRDVTTYLGVRSDGRVSGTAYFGTANADVRLCLYDKQHERMSHGLPDIGPLTRYELRLRAGTGVTLRDAFDPSDVFWHYMPESLLRPDTPQGGWKAGGTGFVLQREPAMSALDRLVRRCQDSAELRALVGLAVEAGPNGLPMFLREVGRLADPDRLTLPRVRVQPAETAVH